MREKMSRYSTVSIILHWTIFLLIFANATFGGWMEEASSADKLQYYELHRSVGITVLLLSLVRLGWRFAHPWPAFPEAMPTWERILARATHVTFYVLMIGAPLLGWAAASSGGAPASDLFGVIPWPNLPLADESLSETLGSAHTLSVKAIYVVLALHVLGALKHHFFDKDVVLARMVPFLPKRS